MEIGDAKADVEHRLQDTGPTSAASLLIVIGETRSNQQRHLVVERLTKGRCSNIVCSFVTYNSQSQKMNSAVIKISDAKNAVASFIEANRVIAYVVKPKPGPAQKNPAATAYITSPARPDCDQQQRARSLKSVPARPRARPRGIRGPPLK